MNFRGHCEQQRPKDNSPSQGKGWPKAGVGDACSGRQAAACQKGILMFYITTPPYGHPF